MNALTDDLQKAADSKFDEAARRGKAIAQAMAPPQERRSDQEAFEAFVLAITTALSSHESQDDPLNFVHSDGRGVLQKGLRDRLIFYLYDGLLIFSIFPLPGLSVFRYRRNMNGQLLNWYQFSVNNGLISEIEMARHVIALAQ